MKSTGNGVLRYSKNMNAHIFREKEVTDIWDLMVLCSMYDK